MILSCVDLLPLRRLILNFRDLLIMAILLIRA
ncbi:hypothetical protein vBEcoMWL3_gp248 [Escherichia phage vB_EcoM_WL-3]|nr:hypothetical protein vBEcoMWL3_gp248 [Escherichia phage vB_EcoM_WL-3]